MSVAPGTAPLAQALVLSRDMLAAAQAADWALLAELEARREPLVMREHAPDGASRRQLGEILAYDRESAALVARARDEAAAQWQAARGRAQAIAAYGEPAR
ncbi:hypothetical protein ASG87_01860 [Frateuria sp. Soil773]|uniref:flagellar protein FliT n=1 Tax=Frateuria sp. Soil773 TaxID=1736407 RepID=UPI0007010218|nr:flagellar protein FliT [Frateuria sp. Soil773]KRE90907.1 hypothetical protein ASG87_01860 [Frateuria sp. Soil773]